MRAMKDSGIEWIGEIPESWRITRHKYVMHKEKDICEHYNGEDIISLTMNGVIVRDLDAGGKMPTTFDGYQFVEPDKLLLCLFDIDVTPRCVGVIRNYGLTSPAYSKIVVHEGYSVEYYNHLLRAIDDDKVLVHLAKNLRSSFTETDFGALPTIAPPLPEQQAISTFINRQCAHIDNIIEKTKASIEEYKKLRQAVITQAVTKGVRGDRPMKDSGIEWIGEIPADCKLTRFQDFGEYKKGPFGSAITKNMFVEKGANTYKVYEQKNAISKNAEIGYYYIDEEKFKQLSEFEVLEHDIIVSCAGTIGECFIIPHGSEKGIINQALMRIRINNSTDTTYFVYLFSSILKYIAEKYSNGSAMKNIPPFSILKKIRVPQFSLEEQSEIAEYLDQKCAEIDTLIAKKESFLTELETYKKSMIYEYVTGKKEVPSA